MATKPWGIIYCPKEGSASNRKRWKKISEHLHDEGIKFDYVQSEAPGSVERLAAMYTRTGYTTIIVVGGDSALSHALCGIIQAAAETGCHLPTLGVIPNGFGNDFAKYWELDPDNYKQTIAILQRHHTRKVDIGQLTIHSTSLTQQQEGIPSKGKTVLSPLSKRDKEEKETVDENYFFLNCINLGVGASITNLRRKTRSLFSINALSYAFSALLLLFHKMKYTIELHVDGVTTRRRAFTLCIGSARGYGQTPSAVPYNGMFDVTLVRNPKAAQIIHGLWLLFSGRFLSHKAIVVWRTPRLQINNLSHAPLSIDGRMIHTKSTSLEVTIHPEAIDFIIP